jgi:hypothetical protein
MKINILTTTIILSSFLFFSFKIDNKVKDWFLAGSNPTEYEIGIVNDTHRNGNVAYLKSTKSKVKKGFGTIMQSFSSDMYNGKKVKLTGFIKSTDVDKWAGMWMRVDSNSKRGISFDNMQNRSIKGTTAWKKYEIILDVPTESSNISYGVLLSGSGEVLLDNLSFEVVSSETEKTGRTRLQAPSNSNFEN